MVEVIDGICFSLQINVKKQAYDPKRCEQLLTKKRPKVAVEQSIFLICCKEDSLALPG